MVWASTGHWTLLVMSLLKIKLFMGSKLLFKELEYMPMAAIGKFALSDL